MAHEYGSLGWSALSSGEYGKALEFFSLGYGLTQDVALLYGRATAFLASHLPRQALIDIEGVITQTNSRFISDSHFAFLGICHWYLARPEVAIAHWRAGLNAAYVDAAGGVLLPTLLYYAGVRLRDAELESDSRKLLKQHWQKFVRRMKGRKEPTQRVQQNFADPDLSGWPGAIVPFLLNELDMNGLLRHAKASEVLAQRHLCQAHFAIAIQAFRGGDMVLFRRSIEKCVQNPIGYLEAEFFLARWEIHENFPDPPFPRG